MGTMAPKKNLKGFWFGKQNFDMKEVKPENVNVSPKWLPIILTG